MNHERRFQLVDKTFTLLLFVLFTVTILGVVAPGAVAVLPAIPSFAGEFTLFVLLFGWPGLYILGQRLLTIWDRRAIASGTSFRPESNGPLLRPDLVATVSGRAVRLSTVSGAHSVAANLDGEPDAGAIVGRPERTELELAEHADRTDGDLAVLASDPAIAAALLTGRSREALSDCEDCSVVFVGDVPAAFQALHHEDKLLVYENGDEQGLGGGDDPTIAETVLRDRTRTADGDLVDPKATAGVDTAVHVTRHDRVSSDALESQASAVAAVASAFENAKTD